MAWNKVTIWQRQYITIEAETKEEALKEIEPLKKEDADFHVNVRSSEYLFESMELLSLEDNDGEATIELYDDETGDFLGDNANPCNHE